MGIAKLLEQVRLRAHFRQVLSELNGRDVSHLATPERTMRERLVGELERYARAGVFPINRDFSDRRMPYFIDASGTRCAMAHLIESTGERDYVDQVRRTRNNAYVRELAGDRALRAWLRAAGLTAAEAARIQPAYCFVTKADACFCNQVYAADGVLVATTTDQVQDGIIVTVDAVHGNTGAIAVGQSVTVGAGGAGAHPGDPVLVPVHFDQQGTPSFDAPFRLAGNAVTLNQCELDVPGLAKADAIAAILATGENGCSMHLADVNATWGESQCDDSGGGNGPGGNDDGGCTIAGSGSSLAVGAALAAALWTRRRPLPVR